MNSAVESKYLEERFNVTSLPRRCEIELSSICNLNCVYCPRKFLNEDFSFMNMQLFVKIIDELSVEPDTILTLHRRGESTLHPHFSECLDYVRNKFSDIQLATNATLLNEDLSANLINTLSFISFSIDAPGLFNDTRFPARYDVVESNILQFLKMNEGRVTTQVSMVRTDTTKDRDVDLFKEIWIGKVDRVRVYEEHSSDGVFGSLKSDRGKRVPCSMPFYEMLVYSDGRVGRCNHDWNGAALGDLTESSVYELWHSPVYNDLRKQHIEQRIQDSVCINCQSWYPIPGKQMTGEVYD